MPEKTNTDYPPSDPSSIHACMIYSMHENVLRKSLQFMISQLKKTDSLNRETVTIYLSVFRYSLCSSEIR